MLNKQDALYLGPNENTTSQIYDQYYFEMWTGRKKIKIQQGDCCFYLSRDKQIAHVARGPIEIESNHFATLIRGYAPPTKSAEIITTTNLPYINGCSTRQIFAPERPGDPTWQMLKIPKKVREQKHHIHPTARIVYVLEGQGLSIVGTPGYLKKTVLRAGMTCILNPMVPHHFETTTSELIVLPVHVWSSIPGLDFNHPMFNGTLTAE